MGLGRVPVTEGKKPADNADERKYLLDKLAEVRKSCEWLLSLGAANIFANLLKPLPGHSSLRQPTLVLTGVQMSLALFGAIGWLSDGVDPAQVNQKLSKRLKTRDWIRNISLFLLVIAFVMLLLQLW